ncbi:MAG: outer membrane protein assembly factor BamD [Planctomycetota bacterium]
MLGAMLLLSVCPVVPAEIRPLEKARDSGSLSQPNQDNYQLLVAQIKKLVDTGQCKVVIKAFNKLKTDFPDITTPESNDLGLFVEAEILRCKGKFAKAARQYGKLLDQIPPESRFYLTALDRQFSIATAFMAGRKKPVLGVFKMKGYAEGIRIMDGINYRLGFEEPLGIKAAVEVAKGYYERKKYDEAFYRWAEIRDQGKSEQLHKDALLAMAQCRLAVYKGYEYDTSALIGRPLNPESYYDSAKSCYEKFRQQYPDDVNDFGIGQSLKEIDEKMALKQLKIGQYYQKTGNKLSANLYFQMVVNRWPQTETAKMANEMLIKNSDSQEKKQ